MYSRLNRKGNPDVEQLKRSSHSFGDLIDISLINVFRITEDEYDFLLDNISDEEIKIFLGVIDGFDSKSTFTEKRRGLELLKRKLDE